MYCFPTRPGLFELAPERIAANALLLGQLSFNPDCELVGRFAAPILLLQAGRVPEDGVDNGWCVEVDNDLG